MMPQTGLGVYGHRTVWQNKSGSMAKRVGQYGKTSWAVLSKEIKIPAALREMT